MITFHIHCYNQIWLFIVADLCYGLGMCGGYKQKVAEHKCVKVTCFRVATLRPRHAKVQKMYGENY